MRISSPKPIKVNEEEKSLIESVLEMVPFELCSSMCSTTITTPSFDVNNFTTDSI